MFCTLILYQEQEIPGSPGLYIFKPNLLSYRSLGLRGTGGFSEKELEVAKRCLMRNVQKLFDIYADRGLIGELREASKSLQNSVYFNLNATPAGLELLEGLISKLQNVEFSEELLSSISNLNDAFPPIYIGIAKQQSLKSRFLQHKIDYDSQSSSTFGGRVSKHLKSWSHLTYYAVPFPLSYSECNSLEIFEDFLQLIVKPVLSLR